MAHRGPRLALLRNKLSGSSQIQTQDGLKSLTRNFFDPFDCNAVLGCIQHCLSTA